MGCISEPLDSTQTETTITPPEPTKIPTDKIADYTDDCIQESPNPGVKNSTYQIAFVSDRRSFLLLDNHQIPGSKR